MIAVISDTHSNYIALNAVMEDIRSLGGVEQVYALGDYIGELCRPRETLKMLIDNDAVMVRGNRDESMALHAKGLSPRWEKRPTNWNGLQFRALKWNYDKLTCDDTDVLSALPLTHTFDYRSCRFHMSHATPESTKIQLDVFTDDELVKCFKPTGADVCLFGHTHIPRRVDADGLTILNPGSIGLNERGGGCEASYLIIDESLRFSHRSVKLDFEALLDDARDSGILKSGGIFAILALEVLYTGRSVVYEFVMDAASRARVLDERPVGIPDAIIIQAAHDWLTKLEIRGFLLPDELEAAAK